MARPITMPKLGQSEERVTLARWLKKEGDSVLKGDVLFEIETDKSLLEVESFFQGTLLRILVAEGTTVPVQTTVAFVGDPGDLIPEVGDRSAQTFRPGREQRAEAQTSAQPAPPLNGSSLLRISPRAARLAKEAAIDPALVVGTGPGGRVVERDVIAYLDAKGPHPAITPSASQPAAQPNTDILSVRKPTGSEEAGASAVRNALAETTIPMSRMRQVIAARLTASFTTTPHFFLTVSTDMTDLLQLRLELNAQGMSYTVTDFIVVAAILSLKEFTAVNSTTDGKNLYRRNKVHLGLAVSLDDGVVVPVIRDGDELTLSEIHERAAALVAKARAGRLTPDEMTGSTFTISNLGMLDVENFTAIINPGEGAILAVSSILKQPVVRNDQIVARQVMKMTLSADHRIIDGALAAAFVNAIKGKLEDVSLWKRLA